MSSKPMTAAETMSVNCACAARHESGHIVIAAVQGLPLRPEGLMVDPSGWGLACYHDVPDDTDPARERNVLAVLAGFAAEKRYREERGYPPRDDMDVKLNRDNVVARTLLGKLAGEYWANDSRMLEQLNRLIDKHWAGINALASAVLAKDWESIRPLKSGDEWLNPYETVAKYVCGKEAVPILAEHGIDVVIE